MLRCQLLIVALVPLALMACSNDTTGAAASTSGGAPDAGVACNAGEMPLGDGGCQSPGVPADGCGSGFESDGAGACRAVLPAAPCGVGTMAVPGETACRPVAPCMEGTWGAIPVDDATEYVDGAYAGGASAGTSAAPWTTVQQGVDAASSGAIVAIAAGTYAEDVLLNGKSVRLWGVCPERVTIAGTGGSLPSVAIERSGASSAEVRDLAITGAAIGVEIGGASGPLLDRVWIHQTGSAGLVTSELGTTEFTLTRSLVETATNLGIYVEGADATIDQSVVRATRPDATGQSGRGIAIRDNPVTGLHATATIRASVLEQNRYTALHVSGSDVTVDACLIRDTQQQASDGLGGRGINVQNDLSSKERATLAVKGSVLESNREAALFGIGSDVTIVRTTVRDTQRTAANILAADGRGLDVESDPATNAPAQLSVVESLISGSDGLGVFLGGCDATIERTAIQDTQSRSIDGVGGRGLELRGGSKAIVRYAAIERNHEVGVFAEGSTLELDACAIRDTAPQVWAESDGYGIYAEPSLADGTPASLTVNDCVIDQNVAAGIGIFGSDATLTSSTVRQTAKQPDGSFGDGVLCLGSSNVTLTQMRIESSARAGISNFGANASVQALTSECNAIQLDAESYAGIGATFTDEGDNVCGCGGEQVACQIASAELAAPAPLAPSAPK